MVTKRTLLSLALLAMLSACTKSADEPISPQPAPGDEPTLRISLSGEIETPEDLDLTPEPQAKGFVLTEGVGKTGKRIITPYYNEGQVPAVLCIYDQYGAYTISRVQLSVYDATSSNGKKVNKFIYQGTLDPRLYQRHYKERSGGAATNDRVQYKTTPGEEGIYATLFIGMNTGSHGNLDIQNANNIRYDHSLKPTLLGSSVDYNAAGPNADATRLIFSSVEEKLGEQEEVVSSDGSKKKYFIWKRNKLNYSTQGYSPAGTKNREDMLAMSDMKIRLRGAIVECSITNTDPTTDIELVGIEVGKLGGSQVVMEQPNQKRVMINGQQRTVVDVPPSIIPDGESEWMIDIPGNITLNAKGASPAHKLMVYLPFISPVSGRTSRQYWGSLSVVYRRTQGNTARKKLTVAVPPLKVDGVFLTKSFNISDVK